MKKRQLFLSSLLVLSVGLAACSNDDDTATKKDDTTKTDTVASDKKEKKQDDHHHAVDFTFEQTSAKVGKETPLSAKLLLEKKPLTKADVRFQITQEGVEKADWVDLKEEKSGHYTTKHIFKEPGKYTLTLHVMKGDTLHDHADNVINVK
ncbi:FixH family protein [Kurthia sibirica]|uniref:FixH family protein n=1 Tax=Kurthia sibirica TaxID=202750 RepID=UPI00116C18C2|nr:FixH family protein [Kurthia sibirica]GEK32970.1 hypothetical protein KSI01_05030 [Kurthia sibirica]